MSLYQNDCLLKALKRQPHSRVPVWLMRQAGRYLPEYLKVRAQAGSFMNLCKNPALACEVTLQPLSRFDLDAAILFSDILTIPDAMGLGVTVEEKIGPQLKALEDQKAVEALPLLDPAHDLSYALEAVDRITTELAGRIPLIGFTGSPWTLACYMIEGGGSKNFLKVKHWLYAMPEALHLLLEKLSQNIIIYLRAQIMAGANPVMLFDSWGGILTTEAYSEFSLAYTQKIIQALKADIMCADIPVILFTKGGGQWLEAQVQTGATCLGLDWTVNLKAALQQMDQRVTLQGNLDPAVLCSSEAAVINETKKILEVASFHPGFIFNVGHGLVPETNPNNISVMINTIRTLLN